MNWLNQVIGNELDSMTIIISQNLPGVKIHKIKSHQISGAYLYPTTPQLFHLLVVPLVNLKGSVLPFHGNVLINSSTHA